MKTKKGNTTLPESHRPDFVNSLAKGLEVLAVFERGDMLGNQDLVARTGLPKTTVSRLTGTLASLGYLRMDERTRKYMMGARMLGIGASVQRHIGLQRTARPFMETLAQELDITVILGARDRTGLVFLELVRPPRNLLTVNTDSGSVVPIESTAIGLAYLVMAPLTERVRVLESLRRHHPDDWDKVRQNIERAHREYLRQGFVVSQHSAKGTVSGVGVPLVLGSKGVFTFACAGPSFELPLARLTKVLGPRLAETVAKIDCAMTHLRQPSVAPTRIRATRAHLNDPA